MIVDTLWVFLAAILVFFMNLGFASLEAGMARSKNTVNILSKNFIVFAEMCIRDRKCPACNYFLPLSDEKFKHRVFLLQQRLVDKPLLAEREDEGILVAQMCIRDRSPPGQPRGILFPAQERPGHPVGEHLTRPVPKGDHAG